MLFLLYLSIYSSYLKSLNRDTDGEEDAAGETDVRATLHDWENVVKDAVGVSKGHRHDNHVENDKQEVRETEKEQEKVANVVFRPEENKTILKSNYLMTKSYMLNRTSKLIVFAITPTKPVMAAATPDIQNLYTYGNTNKRLMIKVKF